MSIAKWDKLYLLDDLRHGLQCSAQDHFTLIPITECGRTRAPKVGELYYAERNTSIIARCWKVNSKGWIEAEDTKNGLTYPFDFHECVALEEVSISRWR